MKRTLRPSIKIALEIITTILSLFLITVNDFSATALPTIVLALAIVLLNLKVLEELG